jgi:hypothetical protein
MSIVSSFQLFLSRQLSKTSKLDGRFLLSGILIIYFIPIFLATSFFSNYPDSWNSRFIYPFVRTMLPPFADMRVITAGAECARLGYDVLVKNPCDPLQRLMNYPRIWLTPAYWGLNQGHTVTLGVLFGCLFFVLTCVIIERLNYTESLFYALILCSPSIMLAIERGNCDLIIFILLALSLLMMKNQNLIYRSFAYGLVLFAAILKLYPIFVLTNLLKEKRKLFFFFFISISTIFVVYVIATFKTLELISKATPRQIRDSYGSMVIFDVIYEFSYTFFDDNLAKLINITKPLLMVLSVVIVVLVAYLLAKCRKDSYQQGNAFEVGKIDAFRLGASIYLGTFLIGNNWDYRLIFLLFTIPQILVWIKSRASLASSSILTLIGVTLTTWLGRGTFKFFYLDEFINWLLFLFYVYAMILTLPKWLQSYVYFQSQNAEVSSQKTSCIEF